MTNIRLIKHRIKSVANIAQITYAMEMVAASKMKKAQAQALQGKPYSEKIYQVVKELTAKIDKKLHPLLSVGQEDGKILIILISTNKGLCGGLNTGLFRKASVWFKEHNDIDFISLGKKGESFLVSSGKNLIADFSAKIPFKDNVPALTKMVVDGFIQGVYQKVYLVYNSFFSVMKQVPFQKIILPITAPQLEEPTTREVYAGFLLEPSIDEILDYLLPHYLENQIRAAIAEAEASEHAARMIAMKNAHDAALDFMAELTLVFNKARQEKITYEIADMVTARLAVES